MKLSITLILLLQALFIAAEALPIKSGKSQQALQHQQPPQRPGPVPVNSWDSSSSGSSDSSSNSKKTSFLGSLKAATQTSKPFKCHSKSAQPILKDLSDYVTDLLRTYRDELLDRKGGPDGIRFEVCMGGYESHDVSPSIFIKEMTKRQLEKLEMITKTQVLRLFPNVKVVRSGNGLALVVKERGKLVRRNTV